MSGTTDLLDPDSPDARQSSSAQDERSEYDSVRFLSRSPHPYLRHGVSGQNGPGPRPRASPTYSRPTTSSSSSLSIDSPTRSDSGINSSKVDLERIRKRSSNSPSESGTEADDEYGYVRALPAPPIKARKGLRDGRDIRQDGGTSPLLTPSYLEDARRPSQDYFKLRLKNSSHEEDTKAARARFIKRRRTEVLRRVSELGLLATIGCIVFSRDTVPQSAFNWHRAELLSHALTLTSLVALYPPRLYLYARARSPSSYVDPRQRVTLPSIFDPAPLIYPTILPILVALSITPKNERILLPNLVLSLSTIPSQLIPYRSAGYGYDCVHWLISVLPLIMSQNTEIPSKILAPKPYMLKLPPGGLDPEIIVSLYALHQALLPPLRYLTATSLLPAELQLLSISLVNLLLFAESPQMIILSTLIWVGALCLFAFGGSVLRYGVALARVPKWKLKRAGNIVKNRESFIRLLTSSLKRDFSVATGWSPPSSAQHSLPESSADESSPYHTHKQNSSLQIQVSDIKSALKGAFERETNSATEQIQEPFILPNNAPSPSSIRRRNTLPAVLKKSLSPQRRLRRRNTSKSGAQQYFLSLTPEQANKKKWIYAIYIYLVMIAIVLGPLRLIISKYAVFGADPFGWAIGYLFGNLRPVRFRIVDMNLDDWIPLPPLQNFPFIFSLQSLRILTIPSLRSLLGAANIRLVLIAYHLIILIAGLTTVLRIPKNFEVDTRRKVFHGMMVAMFLPTTFVDPAFASLALALALVAFLLLDLLRASQLPPLSKPLAAFLTPYVDGRDLRGPVVISHMFLLIGCAIPLWLSLAASTLEGDDPWQGWEVKERDIGMIAGVVCVGMGDAAASLIGRRYGRRKWPWTGGKSLEGSAAFAIAVTVGLVAAKLWLKLGRWDNAGLGQQGWPVVVGKAGASAVAASFCEAVLTGGNDNVVVPVVLWLVVRGVGL